jgi:hypothetical protein
VVVVGLPATTPVVGWAVVPVPLVVALALVVALPPAVEAAAWLEARPVLAALTGAAPAGAAAESALVAVVASAPAGTVPLGAVAPAAVGAADATFGPVLPVPAALPVGLAPLVSAFVVAVVEDVAPGPAAAVWADAGGLLEVPVCVLVVPDWLPVALGWLPLEAGWTVEAVD